jgi:capsular exopolysaccharide synthesis family protein
MGKTYEALQRAEREHKEYLQRLSWTPPKQKRGRGSKHPRQVPDLPGLEPYEELKANLLSRYTDGTIKTILFNGTKHGGGCSTTALNFATALANDDKLRVLLVEVNLRTPSLHKIFNTDNDPGLSEIVTKGGHWVSQIRQFGPNSLYVITCGGGSLIGPLGLFESKKFDQFLKRMRDNFDYIILDAPPVPVFSEFRVLCAKVDGVVLVLEAGETRRHVALRAKKELEEAGGNVLGVVLNRRKFHIPRWVYRRL